MIDKNTEALANTVKKVLEEANLGRVYAHTKGRNIGMISASRGHLTAEENKKRNQELAGDIRKAGYGYVNVRGRYVENHGKPDARNVDEHSFLVIGKQGNDAGELKGFLKKHGEKYDQDSILHKAHDSENAKLHGTNESGWPGKDKEHDVGKWHPNRTPEFHSVMKKGKTFAFEDNNLIVEKLEFLNDKGFFSRRETLF